MKTLIAVIGASRADEKAGRAAFEAGKEVILAGFCLVCGGLGGVMEEACRGAREAAGPDSGKIIGILPGTDKNDANPYVDIVIPTGLGYARNTIITCGTDGIIAVGGGSGTLSEIGFGWQYGKPIAVITGIPGLSAELAGKQLDRRRQDRIMGASSGAEAVARIREALGRKRA